MGSHDGAMTAPVRLSHRRPRAAQLAPILEILARIGGRRSIFSAGALIPSVFVPATHGAPAPRIRRYESFEAVAWR